MLPDRWQVLREHLNSPLWSNGRGVNSLLRNHEEQLGFFEP